MVEPDERPPPPEGGPDPRLNRRLIQLLLVPTGILTALGLVMVLSASFVSAYAKYGQSFLFFKRQAIYAIVGLVALVITARVRYEVWGRLSRTLIVISVAGLALVLHPTTGTSAGGSARWIDVGPFSVQPSELAKFAAICFTAATLAKKWKYLDHLKHVVMPLAPVVGLLGVLIMLQPDLGSMMIIAVTVFLMLFVVGVKMRYLAAGFFGGSAIGIGLIMTAGYRRARWLSFLNPSADPQNTGYQVLQSLLGLGSGGLFGLGLGASRQKWNFLPNAHTDFIYAIIGEELGLIVALAVLVLFGVLLYAGIRIALKAPDVFGRLLAAGITASLGFQALVNIGAVTGILPITGVPLPLVSFGGSSLVVSLASIGVLVAIAREGSGRKRTAKAAAA